MSSWSCPEPTVRKYHQGRTRLLSLVPLDEFNIIDRRGTKPDYFFLFGSWQGFGSLFYPPASIFISEDTNSLLKEIILLGWVNTKGFGEKTFSSPQDECLCPYHLMDFPNLFIQLGNEYQSFLLPLKPWITHLTAISRSLNLQSSLGPNLDKQ